MTGLIRVALTWPPMAGLIRVPVTTLRAAVSNGRQLTKFRRGCEMARTMVNAARGRSNPSGPNKLKARTLRTKCGRGRKGRTGKGQGRPGGQIVSGSTSGSRAKMGGIAGGPPHATISPRRLTCDHRPSCDHGPSCDDQRLSIMRCVSSRGHTCV